MNCTFSAYYLFLTLEVDGWLFKKSRYKDWRIWSSDLGNKQHASTLLNVFLRCILLLDRLGPNDRPRWSPTYIQTAAAVFIAALAASAVIVTVTAIGHTDTQLVRTGELEWQACCTHPHTHTRTHFHKYRCTNQRIQKSEQRHKQL